MTIAEILDKEGVSEHQVLREHAMLTGLANIGKYEAQCSYFEKKHAVSFDTARAKYRELGKEDFGFDDDFVEWEFAREALNWWRTSLEEARHAL